MQSFYGVCKISEIYHRIVQFHAHLRRDEFGKTIRHGLH